MGLPGPVKKPIQLGAVELIDDNKQTRSNSRRILGRSAQLPINQHPLAPGFRWEFGGSASPACFRLNDVVSFIT